MENKKHIVAVTCIIKNKEGKALIIQRGANEIAFPNTWAFPGGKVEKGESILEAIKRECLEEVGIEVEDEKHYLEDFSFTRPDGHFVVGFCYLVKAKNETVVLEKGFQAHAWIHPEELNNYEHIEGMERELELSEKFA